MPKDDAVARVVVALTTAGYPEKAIQLLEKKANPDYKALAKKRMDDAFDRGGVKGMLKATRQRIQRTQDPDKLMGIADAIDDVLEKSRQLGTQWGYPNAEKELEALMEMAIAKSKLAEDDEGASPAWIRVLSLRKHLKSPEVQKELKATSKIHYNDPISLVYLLDSAVEVKTLGRQMWCIPEGEPVTRTGRLVRTVISVLTTSEVEVLTAWVDRTQGVGYISLEDFLALGD
jgi:hypothetical protein